MESSEWSVAWSRISLSLSEPVGQLPEATGHLLHLHHKTSTTWICILLELEVWIFDYNQLNLGIKISYHWNSIFKIHHLNTDIRIMIWHFHLRIKTLIKYNIGLMCMECFDNRWNFGL